VLLIFFMSLVVLKVETLIETPEIFADMSAEQRTMFSLHSQLIYQMVLIGTVGALVASLGVIVALIQFERIRINKSRVWRLPTCDWHLAEDQTYVCFLSHFKVEAGAEARYLKDALDQMLGSCPVYLVRAPTRQRQSPPRLVVQSRPFQRPLPM
jgi:hypothetical protein